MSTPLPIHIRFNVTLAVANVTFTPGKDAPTRTWWVNLAERLAARPLPRAHGTLGGAATVIPAPSELGSITGHRFSLGLAALDRDG